MSRNFNFAPGEYYHCYARGTEKRKVFLGGKDYQRFVALLFVCNSTKRIHLSDQIAKSFNNIFEIERKDTLVEIGAYCLMSNHFHLLLKEKHEGGISLFMQKLMTGYAMYFNKKYTHTGSLFESSYKAKHANKDRYLKYLFSYIHLNPVKIIDSTWKESGIKNLSQAKKYLRGYEYSSYKDYLEINRPQHVILGRKNFPDYFLGKKRIQGEIFEWLNYKHDTDVKVKP